MNIENYRKYMTAEMLMGPNSLRVLRELLDKYPLHHERIETFEMDCFEPAWNEWFATGHEYALGDQRFFERLIRPYTCFVGVCIKVK